MDVGEETQGITGLRGDLMIWLESLYPGQSTQIAFGACGNPVSELSVFTSSRDSQESTVLVLLNLHTYPPRKSSCQLEAGLFTLITHL